MPSLYHSATYTARRRLVGYQYYRDVDASTGRGVLRSRSVGCDGHSSLWPQSGVRIRHVSAHGGRLPYNRRSSRLKAHGSRLTAHGS
jgi:hypothetical protein